MSDVVLVPSLTETELPSAEQQSEFLAYLREHQGCSVKEAAEATGSKRKHFKALIVADEEFAGDYREARGYGDEDIRKRIRQRAFDDDRPADRLLLEMARAYLPEYADVRRLELSGPDGGPIELERRIVVGISDVVRLARELGVSLPLGVDGGDPRGELPPAQDVLPDSPPD